MHGIIFAELKKFVDTNLGAEAWPALLEKAGLSPIFCPSILPDERLCDGDRRCSITGTPADHLLESFGGSSPRPDDDVRAYVRKEWTTLDVLEHTEETITASCDAEPVPAPPAAGDPSRFRPRDYRVQLSPKMCRSQGTPAAWPSTTRGIAMAEATCMHRGDPVFRISVRRQ